jgi:hypothetical protein
MCGNTIVRAKTKLNGEITEKISEFKYLGSIISNYNTGGDLEHRIQTFNKRVLLEGALTKKSRKKLS